MCQFFSCIVLRNGDVLWHEATDSHSDLVTHFALPDSNRDCTHFAKVEFTPKYDNDKKRPLYEEPDQYELKVDEPTCPAWFEEVRGLVEKKLRTIIRGMIVDDVRPLILGGCRILVGKSDIRTVKAARIIVMLESSKVGVMWGSSKVGVMWESSKVGVMLESSKVGEMWDTAQSPKAPETDKREKTNGKGVKA